MVSFERKLKSEKFQKLDWANTNGVYLRAPYSRENTKENNKENTKENKFFGEFREVFREHYSRVPRSVPR